MAKAVGHTNEFSNFHTVLSETMKKNLRFKLDQLEADKQLNAQNIYLLKEEYKHSIEMLGRYDCNCVGYALGLYKNDIYKEIIHSSEILRDANKPNKSPNHPWSIFADTEFLHYCLDAGKLVDIGNRNCCGGDLVIYLNGNGCRHIGVPKTLELVTSHWGDIGLFEHKIDEVPANYGHKLLYINAIDRKTAMHHFVDYAKSVADEECLSKLTSILNEHNL